MSDRRLPVEPGATHNLTRPAAAWPQPVAAAATGWGWQKPQVMGPAMSDVGDAMPEGASRCFCEQCRPR